MLVKIAQEGQAQLKKEYPKKLELENCTLLDPFKLENGWIKEEDGIVSWSIIPDQSAKIRVPHALALHLHHALRALIPDVRRVPHAFVPCVPHILHTLVPYVSRFVRVLS